MRSRRIRLALGITIAASLVAASIAVAAGRDGGKNHGQNQSQFQAHLIGFNEVPPINTKGQADLSLTVASDKITFQLTYSNLSGAPSAAHVHIGQVGVNGGVSFFFCGGGGKPACPNSSSGSVSGTVAAADVLAQSPNQGFAAGDLASVITAIQAGVTYANMHTATFPGGEIRGQVVGGSGHGHDDNDD